MTDHNENQLNEAQQRAVDAVQGLTNPRADADFRARLKQQFVSGDIDPKAKVVVHAKPVSSRRWLTWAPLAAAAVLAVALFFGGRLPGPDAMGAHLAGTVVIDGHEVAAADSVLLDDLLHPGAVIELRDGAELDILYPGSLVMRLASGTTMTLPERPRRWFSRNITADMSQGEISIRTGPQFAGNMLAVQTPEGRARIYGTLVSVFRNDDLTCVCLFEGTAVMDDLSTELGPIPVGKRWVLYTDGRAAELLDIAPPHQEHMEGLDRARCDCFTR